MLVIIAFVVVLVNSEYLGHQRVFVGLVMFSKKMTDDGKQSIAGVRERCVRRAVKW